MGCGVATEGAVLEEGDHAAERACEELTLREDQRDMNSLVKSKGGTAEDWERASEVLARIQGTTLGLPVQRFRRGLRLTRDPEPRRQ